MSDLHIGIVAGNSGHISDHNRIHARLQGIFSVMEPTYGAVGDANGAAGIGTDDTVAINAALAAAAGGILVFPTNRKYRITANLTPLANTTILGWGAAIVVDNAGGDLRGIDVRVDDVAIYGLEMFSTNPTTRGHQMIAYLNGANRGTVEKCHLHDCGQYGILVGDTGTNSGAEGHRFLNNNIDMTNAKAAVSPFGIIVFPKGGAGFLVEQGVIIEGNNITVGAVSLGGIKVQAQRGGRIVDNRVVGGTSASYEGSIDVHECKGVIVADNTIYNTRFGITVAGQAGIDNGLRNQNITLANNTISKIEDGLGSSSYGIYASDGFAGLIITGNQIDNDGGTANALIALYPQNGGSGFSDLIIDANILLGAPVAIDLDDDAATGLLQSDKAKIRGNHCADQTGSAIKVQGDDVDVSGNSIIRAGTAPLTVTGARPLIVNNTILDGNTSNAASQPGISILGANPQVLGNHIENVSGGTGHLKVGLSFLTGTTGIVRRDNVITGMETSKTAYAGTTSQVPRSQYFLTDNTSDSHTGDTTETQLKASTIPASDLGTQGGLRIRASGTVSGTNNTKTIRLKLAANTLGTISCAAGTEGDWSLDAELWMRDSQSAEVTNLRFYDVGALEATFPDQTTHAIAMTSDRTLEITGQLANAGDTITADQWSVEVIA